MAKEVRFSKDARESMLRGVNTLANAVSLAILTPSFVINGEP